MAEGAERGAPGPAPPEPAGAREAALTELTKRRAILGLAVVSAFVIVGFLLGSRGSPGGTDRQPEGSIWFGTALNLVTREKLNTYELVGRTGTFSAYSDVAYLASLARPGSGLRMWLKFDGTTLTELGCDRPDGSVVVEGVLPDTAPGRWTIEITDAEMHLLASGEFTVLD